MGRAPAGDPKDRDQTNVGRDAGSGVDVVAGRVVGRVTDRHLGPGAVSPTPIGQRTLRP